MIELRSSTIDFFVNRYAADYTVELRFLEFVVDKQLTQSKFVQ